MLTDWDKISNLYRAPSIYVSYKVSVHLAKQFQRRRFLEIDKSETSIAYGGRGFKVFYNRRYVLNFRRYLKKIGRGSGAHLSAPVGPGQSLVGVGGGGQSPTEAPEI